MHSIFELASCLCAGQFPAPPPTANPDEQSAASASHAGASQFGTASQLGAPSDNTAYCNSPSPAPRQAELPNAPMPMAVKSGIATENEQPRWIARLMAFI